MRTVTVVYPDGEHSVTFQIQLPERFSESSIKDILCYVWETLNPDNGNSTLEDIGLNVRSSMVGDIYMIDGQNWTVDSIGFVRVSHKDSLILQHLFYRDRIMGWTWLKDMHVNTNTVMASLDEPLERIQ